MRERVGSNMSTVLEISAHSVHGRIEFARFCEKPKFRSFRENYDNSVGNGLADCQCGYTDPRDNYFAKQSYDYTFRHTSRENKNWLRKLPREIRIQVGSYRVLLCHGSPRKMNEFL